MFSKDYHPLDSRHPANRAVTKTMKARRFSETREGRVKAASGGLFTPDDPKAIRAQLQAVEAAPVLDLDAQKRLKKRLKEPARIEAERAFWKGQPWYLRLGPLRMFTQLFAIDAGQAARGTPLWLRVISLPVALVLYIVMVRADQTFGINAFLKQLGQDVARFF